MSRKRLKEKVSHFGKDCSDFNGIEQMKTYIKIASIAVIVLFPPNLAHADDLPQQVNKGKELSIDNLPDATASDAGLIEKTKSAELQYVDSCDRSIKPKISNISLGESLSGSKLILLPDAECYGNAGAMVVILDASGRTLLRVSGGGVVVLPSQTDGVNNIALIEPGFEVPVWKWSAEAHAFQHYINVPLNN